VIGIRPHAVFSTDNLKPQAFIEPDGPFIVSCHIEGQTEIIHPQQIVFEHAEDF
jgi:hypothetical protein